MKLVIIGNGFDCAHGLNTSYCKFREYIKNNDIEEYKFLHQLFGNAFETDEFWWNFEESLSNFNLSNFTYDLEINNDFQRKNGFEDEDCIKSNKEYFDNHIFQLKKLFCLWIKEINDNKISSAKKKDSISEYLNDAVILSFNYTSTIENLYEKECYHIHGFIDDVDVENGLGIDDIVLGHSYNISFVIDNDENISAENTFAVLDNGEQIPFESLSFVKEYDLSNDDAINKTFSDIDCKYENIFTKRCSNIIEKDEIGFFYYLKNNAATINEVVVLGHSLSNVDKPYFKKILEILKVKCDPVKWTVSCYGNNKSTLKNNLRLIDENAEPSFICIS